MRLRRHDAEYLRDTEESPGFAVLLQELAAERNRLLDRLLAQGLSAAETEYLRGRISAIDYFCDLPRMLIDICRQLPAKDKDPE